MIRYLNALFRVRQLLALEAACRDVTFEIDAYDRRLNGTAPRYEDSRAPTGDDYNAILSITERLRS